MKQALFHCCEQHRTGRNVYLVHSWRVIDCRTALRALLWPDLRWGWAKSYPKCPSDYRNFPLTA